MDDRLVVAYYESSDEKSSYSMGDFSYLTEDMYYLLCCDAGTGTVLWENEHPHIFPVYETLLDTCTDEKGEKYLLFSYSNYTEVIRPDTGEILGREEAPSPIVSMDVSDDAVYSITVNGQLCMFDLNDLSSWRIRDYFGKNVSMAKFIPGNAWVSRSSANSLIHYTAQQSDPTWIRFDDPQADSDFYIEDSMTSDQYAVIRSDRELLIGKGKDTEQMIHFTLPDGEDYRKYSLQSIHGTELTMYWQEYSQDGFAWLDLETLDLRMETLDRSIYDWGSFEVSPDGKKNYLIGYKTVSVSIRAEHALCLVETDRSMNVIHSTEICRYSDKEDWQTIYNCDGSAYIVIPSKKEAYLVGFSDGKSVKCSAKVTESLLSAGVENESYIRLSATDGQQDHIAVPCPDNRILLVSRKKDSVQTITGKSLDYLTQYLTRDGMYLLTVETDSYLRVYRTDDASLVSQSSIYTSGSITMEDFRWQETSEGFIILFVNNYADLISMDDWGVFAYVPQCYGYMESQDFFPCYRLTDSLDYEYGGFPRHSVDSLIVYGKTLLNGWEMPDELKMLYGIQD